MTAIAAADELAAKHGLAAEVIDLRAVVPLNYDPLVESVRKTGKVLLASDAVERGSVMHTVASNLTELCFDYLDGPVTRVAGPDVPGVPYNHVLEDWFMVSPEKIADAIRILAAY